MRIVLISALILSIFLTGIGLLLQVALKTKSFTDWVLLRWPSYLLAIDGIGTLKDFKNEISINNNIVNIGILNIDQASWKVILDFVQSDIAFRKSARGEEPEYIVRTPPPPSPESSATPAPHLTQSSAKDQAVLLPKINYERIKSIVSLRTSTNILVGDKAVVPPYRLAVLWPPNVTRIVYEFVSFEEFRLDLRRMIIDQLEGYAKWLSLGGFVCGLMLSVLRWVIRRRETRGTAVSS
jgi:hypothetical protein